jgi:porphobilinogen synthase
MLHLTHRPRRLRSTPTIRQMVRETRVNVDQLIYPLFISEKVDDQLAVPSMPGISQLSVSRAVEEAKAAADSGIPALLLFGIPKEKDEQASQAYASDGVTQRAVAAIKQALPNLTVIADVCLCEYMSHGHCGVIAKVNGRYQIENDASVDLLVRTAVSLAEAGADIVAPSDMMDGRVGAIRSALDSHDFTETAVMSYASKFSSAFYGPFRDAAENAPQFGDRSSYQMDPANALEALREVATDIEEGAELLIVKPGIAYLDILWRIKERFELPTAVYNVSGEYAMVKAAAQQGWLDEKRTVLELMTAFRRAGADLIITYWAKDLAVWLR